MKQYMVHFRRSALAKIDPEIVKAEQQRMAALMQEKVILQVYMSKQMDNLWMIFRVNDTQMLVEIIKTLPMSRDLYFESKEILAG